MKGNFRRDNVTTVRQAVTRCLEALSGCKSYLGAGKTSVKKKLSSTAV